MIRCEKRLSERRPRFDFSSFSRFFTGFSAVLNLLFPPRCAFCGTLLPEETTDRSEFCESCREKLVPAQKSFCRCCGRFSPVVEQTEHLESKTGSLVLKQEFSPNPCVFCREERVVYDRVVPLGEYRLDLRKAVLIMKRDRSGILARAASKLLVEVRAGEIESLGADGIVPVPMHLTRRWVRGVNSPELIAEQLSRSFRIPLYRSWIRRTRSTKPQYHLNPREREKNVKNAFELASPLRVRFRTNDTGAMIRGKTFLLVDDILTTGSTCREIAKLLLHHGARSVAVCVLARTLGREKDTH